ncbi:MAG: MFS transporter [Candidatus Acidiferrales bacterium]
MAAIGALRLRNPAPELLDSLDESEWRAMLAWGESARLAIPIARSFTERLPQWVRRHIEQNVADNSARFERIRSDYLAISDALKTAEVEHLVLKGFSLWPDLAEHPRLRLQSDIDLLCPPGSLSAARAAVEALGYRARPGAKVVPYHLPSLNRQTEWKWLGNHFDPEMPVSVELHFSCWDVAGAQLAPAGLDDFWGRRIERKIEDFTFRSLCPADHLAFYSLHLLRHTFAGSASAYNARELARFLHARVNDDEFWNSWNALHDESLRRLQAVCFRLASEWFDCDMHPAVRAEIERLPVSVNKWFEKHSQSPLATWFHANKDGVWLHAALLDGWRSRSEVVLQGLLPTHPPSHYLEGVRPATRAGAPASIFADLHARTKYFDYMASRATHHVRMLPAAITSGLRLWWATRGFERPFWTYLIALIVFDLGMFVFFFLFNLYLLDCGYREDFIGLVTSLFAIGSIAGTIPGGILANRLGLRATQALCYVAVPVLMGLRLFWIARMPQLFLAFFAGAAATITAVCYAPTLAQTTNPRNRAFGFSLVASVLIGLGFAGSMAGAELPALAARIEPWASPARTKQFALLVSCGIMALALWPISRLRLIRPPRPERKMYSLTPFLRRYLPAIAVWSLVTGAFAPFFALYFTQFHHMNLKQIAFIFSSSQLTQVIAILAAPAIFRKLKLVPAIVLMQLATAAMLVVLAMTPGPTAAGIVYVAFSCFLWMSEPGLETLLMNEVPSPERSGASALNMLVICTAQAAAAAAAGAAFVRFGYPAVLCATALIALVAAMVFRFSLGERSGKRSEQGQEAAMHDVRSVVPNAPALLEGEIHGAP